MTTELLLPALRGILGEWVFYACLMPLEEVSKRIEYASAHHRTRPTELSRWIQRTLQEGRAVEIADYLLREKQRFFNSLVVAVYGGDPAWHPLTNLKSVHSSLKPEDIPSAAQESLGVLRFSGEEKLFALDGQHRLAGIKRALPAQAGLRTEEVSVLFVAHRDTPAGMERTRRLFTTLNKRAKPVSVAEIIALDEDDVMAITVRYLVEKHPWFMDGRVSFQPKANLAANDVSSLTTIVNLYDVLTIAFRDMYEQRDIGELKYYRPPEQDLKNHRKYAVDLFSRLRKHIPALAEFFNKRNFKSVVGRHRGTFGGNVFFRPAGLRVMVEALAEIHEDDGLEKSVRRLAKIPQELTRPPFSGVLWNPKRHTMKLAGASLARRLVLHMLGHGGNEQELASEYAAALEVSGNGMKQLNALPRVR